MTPFTRFARSHAPGQVNAIGAAVVLAIVAAVTLAAIPGWSRWSNRVQLRLDVNAAAQRAETTRARISTLRRDLAALSAASDQTLASLPDTLDRRLLSISATAGEHGVLVDSIEPGGTARRSGERPSIAVTARGSYPALIAWIHHLRNAAPDLMPQAIQLSTAANDLCSCRLSLSWWQSPAAASLVANATDGGER